ncbi:MAG: acyl-CoA dehydrogenase, partial [Acidimicrobiales bacterium]
MPVQPMNLDDFGGELNQLAMSESARPFLEKVRTFIAEEVEPMSTEFHKLDGTQADRWSYAPGQLELLEETKSKAKANGLWNFFLP